MRLGHRTGDLTRLLPGTARTMRRMEKVTGRIDDMMIVRGVNVFPTQIEEQVLKCAGLSPHFQIELNRQARLDEITVIVEARVDHASEEARTASAHELLQHIKGVIGISAKIEVGDPGAVPRSEGKAKRIVDLRSRE